MYVVWTSWNSFDLTLSHHTIFVYTHYAHDVRLYTCACVNTWYKEYVSVECAAMFLEQTMLNQLVQWDICRHKIIYTHYRVLETTL